MEEIKKFYGRVNELAELNKRYDLGKKQFVVIYGRRRIGKTELINTFCDGKDGIYFQAIEGDEKANLISFSYVFAKTYGLDNAPDFACWEAALDAVQARYSGRRFYFVIDEYPFIVGQFGAFASILQAFYEKAQDNLFLVLLGSDVSFLKKELADKKSSLYKRRACTMRLDKMQFSEALRFLDGLDTENKCSYMSLMSSYPFYLDAIDKDLSFEENLIDLLYDENGLFAQLPDILLSNSTEEQDSYHAVLQSISRRHNTVAKISGDTGMGEEEISCCVNMLLYSEIIEERPQFGDDENHFYAIGDPMLRFWYSYIYPNQEQIRYNHRLVYENSKTQIHDFMCHAFEDMCRLYLEELNGRGELGVIYQSFRRFEVGSTSLGRSVELDGLAQHKKTILVMECKYRDVPFDNDMLSHLEESVNAFFSKRERRYYIFSKSGFAKNFNFDPTVVHCYTPETMFGISDKDD